MWELVEFDAFADVWNRMLEIEPAGAVDEYVA
jgi:hypothetical protein